MRAIVRVMATYQALHKRVRRHRGSASAHACAHCGQSANHWATIHGTDGSDLQAHYVPLCQKCHWAYDNVGEKSAQKRRGMHWARAPYDASAQVIRADNKSGVPGVHWHGQIQRWRVQVRKISGGTYATLADATKARNALAVKIYGPEARMY